MARTPLFKSILRIMQVAAYAEKRKIPVDHLINRRDALRKSLKIAAAIPLAGFLMPDAFAGKKRNPFRKVASSDTPVIIIGAGTAGLTAAYRLTKAGIPCEIYEGSNRVGGRMYTQHQFNDEGMFCERGGELVDTDHTALQDLCKEIGLSIQPIVDTDTTIEKELYFIQGKLRTQAELLAAFQPLARHLNEDLKRIFGDKEVDVPTYSNPYRCESYDRMTLREYLYSKRDVDSWVLDLVNVCYTGEYGLETDQQSAMNLLVEIGTASTGNVRLLGVSDECRRVQGGNGSLPHKLAQLIHNAVPIQMGHELVGIKDNGTALTLIFHQNGKPVEVNAHQIISAIPFTVLRSVDGIFDLDLSARKKKAIREWGYGTNSKFMMGFKQKYWRNPALNNGHKSSGLVYSDTSGQEFWETSRAQPGTSGIITSFMGGNSGLAIPADPLKTSLDDWSKIFPGAHEHSDSNKVFQHWPSYKFTLGSYSCQKPGQYTDLVGSPGEPELGGRFCFAGEHTSIEYSGFMNGAVESGNTVAKVVIEGRKKSSKTAQVEVSVKA